MVVVVVVEVLSGVGIAEVGRLMAAVVVVVVVVVIKEVMLDEGGGRLGGGLEMSGVGRIGVWLGLGDGAASSSSAVTRLGEYLSWGGAAYICPAPAGILLNIPGMWGGAGRGGGGPRNGGGRVKTGGGRERFGGGPGGSMICGGGRWGRSGAPRRMGGGGGPWGVLPPPGRGISSGNGMFIVHSW